MYINFWYPAEESETVRDKPLKVRMLGQDLVLFRDQDGTAHCLSNICIHRYGSLGNGKVRNGCIECPYHGWLFNGDGQCVRIPSLGSNGSIPSRAKVDAYPVQEKYGLIFVFLGDLTESERIPIQEIPEWDQSGWRFNKITYTWRTSFQRAIENSLDPAHTEFVHPAMGQLGDRDYALPDIDIEEREWGAGTTMVFHPPKPKGFWGMLRKEGTTVESGVWYHGPAQSSTRVHINKKAFSHQYSFDLPIDEDTVKVFFFQARNFFTSRLFDKSVDKRTWAVANQDRDVVQEIQPSASPESPTAEVTVKADALSMHYRSRLKEWKKLGWRIDEKRLRNTQGEAETYTIPSPARRSQEGWCLNPVPTCAND